MTMQPVDSCDLCGEPLIQEGGGQRTVDTCLCEGCTAVLNRKNKEESKNGCNWCGGTGKTPVVLKVEGSSPLKGGEVGCPKCGGTGSAAIEKPSLGVSR